MSFTLEQFVGTRPRLYHLTARANLSGIEAHGELWPAHQLMQRASDSTMLRTRRSDARLFDDAAGQVASLRDQRPLSEGNVALEDGWTFEDLIEALNRRVFFWPGTDTRPIPHGVRHFRRYLSEEPIVIRVRTAALFELNPAPEFCRYNSGSPRCTGGRKSPRGPDTFASATAIDASVGEVVEVTFEGPVLLPGDFEVLAASSFA